GFGQISTGTIADEPTLHSATSQAARAVTEKVVSVADYIEGLVEDLEHKLTIQRVGPVSGALFIWTALSLVTTMENSLNRVFGGARSRAIPRRVFLYWAVMTLGPIAWAAATYLGEHAMAAFDQYPGLAWLAGGVDWLGSLLIGVAFLALVYVLLPNTTVRLRP